MKTKFLIIVAVLLGITFSVFAYSPYYTHPDLTEEIAKLFNFKNTGSDIKISANEIKWMREGAIDEDTPPRWINHFYNSSFPDKLSAEEKEWIVQGAIDEDIPAPVFF